MTNELMDFCASHPPRHCEEHSDEAIHTGPWIAASAPPPRNDEKEKNGWTDERREKARQAIRRNAPWTKSTGPKTAKGKKKSSANAVKHGHRGAAWRDFYTLLARQRRFVRKTMARRLSEGQRAEQLSMISYSCSASNPLQRKSQASGRLCLNPRPKGGTRLPLFENYDNNRGLRGRKHSFFGRKNHFLLLLAFWSQLWWQKNLASAPQHRDRLFLLPVSTAWSLRHGS